MVVDEFGKIIENPDLTKGWIATEMIIKDTAVPVDNVSKFAYDDDDYEEISRYIPYSKQEFIEDLKRKLEATDYVALKIAEGAATIEEYEDIIKNRAKWRNEINELQDN